jgi:hypothetical protein
LIAVLHGASAIKLDATLSNARDESSRGELVLVPVGNR